LPLLSAPPMPEMSSESTTDERPLVHSLTGTFLKKEMQSIYRQLANLQRHRTHVFAEKLENVELFPLENFEQLTKIPRPRPKGNFILRFWYKHVIKQWPPPRKITREPDEYFPYDLVDILRRDQPDLVHVYYGHKAVKYREMLKAWGGPWVVSFHGVDVVKFFDQDGYHDEMKAVFAQAQLVLARSESLLGALEALGCPKNRLRLNRTPIPMDGITARVPTSPSDGRWRLLQACRLIEKKGILTTLQALAEVKKTYPNLLYILCGDGPDREKIEAEAERLRLGDNVEIRGWTQQKELAEEFTKAHLFLHPSELTGTSDQEGVPNSMLEAMSYGLPIVATLHGGIPEAVRNGTDGLLVPEKSPDKLAEALLSVMGDPELLAKLSTQAAAGVRERYGLKASIGAMEDCYEEAVGSWQEAQAKLGDLN